MTVAPVRPWPRLRQIATLAAALSQLAGTTALSAPPARGSDRLLEAMEGNTLSVVGRVGQIERLDAHGYAGSLWVERVLGGRAGEHEEGTPLRIAWEELASGRPPRFDESDRVVVVLERLGAASIWRKRIPDASARRQTLAVALGGDAFLRDPSLGTLDTLHHYLSIAAAERTGATGVGYLAMLTTSARLPLALGAARRLARIDELGQKLGRAGEEALVNALLRRDAEPQLAPVLVAVMNSAGTPSLAQLLMDQTRARSQDAPPARLFEALAATSENGLSAADLEWLLSRDDSSYREIVARTASGENAAETLRELTSRDPAPEVRAVALLRLTSLEGEKALPAVLSALADPNPAVRAVASRGAGSFGDAAVPDLRAVAYGTYAACCKGSVEAPRAAIAGLSLAGPLGRLTLTQIASAHPDPALRRLASIAIGKLNSHAH